MTKEPDKKRAKPTEADLAAAARLQALWEKRPEGVKQQVVADILDITQSAVSQFLLGKIPLNYTAVVAFARALGCRPEDIRTDLPEQLVAYPEHTPSVPLMIHELSPDERALLEKYRRADSAGKTSLHAVGDAFAKPGGKESAMSQTGT